MSVHEKAANLEERMEYEKGEIWVTNKPILSCFIWHSFQLFTAFNFSYKIILLQRTEEQPFLKQMISSYMLTNCQFQPSQGWILKAGFCSSWMNRIRWMLSAARSAVTCYAQQVCGARIDLKTVRLYR